MSAQPSQPAALEPKRRGLPIRSGYLASHSGADLAGTCTRACTRDTGPVEGRLADASGGHMGSAAPGAVELATILGASGPSRPASGARRVLTRKYPSKTTNSLPEDTNLGAPGGHAAPLHVCAACKSMILLTKKPKFPWPGAPGPVERFRPVWDQK